MELARGEGRSKKEAEIAAAVLALENKTWLPTADPGAVDAETDGLTQTITDAAVEEAFE